MRGVQIVENEAVKVAWHERQRVYRDPNLTKARLRADESDRKRAAVAACHDEIRRRTFGRVNALNRQAQ
jgi:hypothetical protein